MGKYSQEEILKIVEEEDVEFIRLQFTDMFGNLKNIAVTARELPRALNNEYSIDGSSIGGNAGCVAMELYLHPDIDTFCIMPWRPQQSRVARMLCDVYKPDGKPCGNSSRAILRRVTELAAKKGYSCKADVESEFFLFHLDDNGIPTTVTHEQAEYLDISPLDLGENARRDMVLNLEDMGIEVMSSHHEKAPAQHEIDFRDGEPEEMADRIVTFKMVVRTIAKRHGLHATFMPKPKTEVNGSGMHVKFCLMKDGKNILEDASDENGLSAEGYYFVGGLLTHSREMALITNPLVNSYKRLVPGFEAPTDLLWSLNDTDALVMIQQPRGMEKRIEMRSPDSASNPYLVFALCIAAGLDGIENKIRFPKDVCIYDSVEGKMPQSLKEAIEIFERSEWVKNVLGESFCEKYAAVKREEWMSHMREVTDWEIKRYLYKI